MHVETILALLSDRGYHAARDPFWMYNRMTTLRVRVTDDDELALRLCALPFLALLAAGADNQWTQFRGPNACKLLRRLALSNA